MELFFGEFIKQLIAAIMAIFMPLSAATSIAEQVKGQVTITIPSVYEQRAEVQSTDDQLVEELPEVPVEDNLAE